MVEIAYFSEQLVELEPLKTTGNSLPPPLAFYIDQFCNARSPIEALTAIDDFFKVSNDLTLLFLFSILRDSNSKIPKGSQKTIQRKWLRGSIGMTEGEKLDIIEEILRDLQTKGNNTQVECIFLEAYPTERDNNIANLLKSKNLISHSASGDDECSLAHINEILPCYVALVKKWNILSNLEVIRVDSTVAWHLAGTGNPTRGAPHKLGPGLYLATRDSKHIVKLDPFIRAEQNGAIQTFSHFSGRNKLTNPIYQSRWPEVKTVEGPIEVLDGLKAILPVEEPRPLFGLDKPRQKLTSLLKSWDTGKQYAPIIFVTGEEGTGKTSLIAKCLDDITPEVKCIQLSGDAGQGEMRGFCFEILAGLFGVDQSNERQIAEHLLEFGRRSGLMTPTKTLGGFLTDATEVTSVTTKQLQILTHSDRDEKWADGKFEIYGADGDIKTQRIYAALFSIIKMWAGENNQKVLIWLQDAQLYERQPDVAIETFLKIQRKNKYSELLVIAEFRAERTRDSKRIRERFSISGNVEVETPELDKRDIVKLVAWRLEVAAEELSEHVGDELYKSSGGNPKWILDVLQTVIDKDVVHLGQSPVEISLLLPRYARNMVSGELKNINKSRLQEMRLSNEQIEILTVLAFSTTRVVSASFISNITNLDIQSDLLFLEENGFIKDDTSCEDWSLTFEHLATKQACQEYIRDQDSSLLLSIASKFNLALERYDLESEIEDLRRITGVVKELAEITKTPEALAFTVSQQIRRSKLADLLEWSSILRKSVQPSHFLQTVKDYLSLRICEEDGVAIPENSLNGYVERSSIFQSISGVTRARRYIEIRGLTLALIAKLRPDKAKQIENIVIEFLQFLSNNEQMSLLVDERFEAFGTAYWRDISGKPEHKVFFNSVDEIARRVSELSLPPLLQLLSTSYGRIFKILNVPNSDFKTTDLEEVESLLHLIESSCESLLDGTGNIVVKDRVPKMFDLLSNQLLFLVASTSIDILATVQNRLFITFDEIGKSGDNKNIDRVRRTLSYEISKHLAKSKEENADTILLSFIDSLINFPEARLVAIASALQSRFKSDLNIDILIPIFSSVFQSIEHAATLDLRDFALLFRALSICDLTEISSVVDKLVSSWVTHRIEDEENLQEIIELYDLAAKDLNWDEKAHIDKLLGSRNWKKDELDLIKLEQSGFIDSSNETDWIKAFSVAKEQYLAATSGLGGTQRKALLQTSFRLLVGLVKLSIDTCSKDVKERISQFLHILDVRTPATERNVDALETYWSLRWRALRRMSQRQVAVHECKDLLEKFGAINRKELVPHLAKMLGPLRAVDDETSTEDEESKPYVLSEEALSFINEWHEISPANVDCGMLLVSAASYKSGPEAMNILEQAEITAKCLVDEKDYAGAARLYGNLLFGYYREHDAHRSNFAGIQEITYGKKIRPKLSVDELNSMRNNSNYVQLGLAIRAKTINQSLLTELRDVSESSTTKNDLKGLQIYNYAIALAYSGQLQQAGELIKSIFSAHQLKTEIRKNRIGWAFIYLPQNTIVGQIEVENVHLAVPALLSMTQLLISLNRHSEAVIWASALEKRLRQEKTACSNQTMLLRTIELFNALGTTPTAWLKQVTSKSKVVQLIKWMEKTIPLETQLPKKGDPCPCKSGALYRECCQGILRLEV